MASDGYKPKLSHLARRRERSIGLWFMDMPQTALMLVAAIISVVALNSGGIINVLSVVLIVAAFGSFTFLPVVGRPAYDWVPAILFYLMRTAKGQGKPAKTGSRRAAREAHGIALSKFTVTPAQHVKLLPDGRKIEWDVAIVCDDAGTYSLAFMVDGSPFLLQDAETQDQWASRWPELLNRFSGPGAKLTGVTIHSGILPATTAEHELHYPDMSDDYRELMEKVAQEGCSHLTTVVLQTSMARQRKGLRKKNWGAAGKETIIRSLLDMYTTFETHLEDMGGRNIRPYSPFEFPLLMRLFLKPYEHDSLFRGLQSGQIRDPEMWPTEIDESPGSVATDGTLHLLLAAEHWPTAGLRPDWLWPLLNARGPVHMVTMTWRPISHAWATQKHQVKATFTEALSMERKQAGRIESADSIRAREERDGRRHQLAHGHSEWLHSMLIRVSGRNTDELDANHKRMLEQTARCGIELRPRYLEQLTSLRAVLPIPQRIR